MDMCAGIDLQYFKDEICSELKGAICYIKIAMEIKAMDSSWSKSFAEMSSNELYHATTLYKMFVEYCELISKPYDDVPEYILDMRNEVGDMYMEKSAKVKYMHEMYSK